MLFGFEGEGFVEYAVGGFELGEFAELGAVILGDEGHHGGVSREARSFCLQAVGAGYIEVFLFEFGFGIFEEVFGLHGKAADDLVFFLFLS